MIAPTTPQAAVFQAWFSSRPRARARRAISQAPTKHPNAMPTPCGENCTGPMPIRGMTFQPIMGAQRPSYGRAGGAVANLDTFDCARQALSTMRTGELDWLGGMTDDLCDLRALHRSKGPR